MQIKIRGGVKMERGEVVKRAVLPPCPRGGQADFSGGCHFKGKRG